MDIVFSRPAYAGGPLDLVFGSTGGVGGPVLPLFASGSSALGGVLGFGVCAYDNRNPLRVSAGTTQRHQPATTAAFEPAMPTQPSTRLLGGTVQPMQRAQAAEGTPRQPIGVQGRVSGDSAQVHQVATQREAGGAQVHQATTQLRQQAAQAHQVARALQLFAAQIHRAGTLTHTRAAQPLQQALALRTMAAQISGAGRFISYGHVQPFQAARRVPPGKEVWPPVDGGGNGFDPYVPDLAIVFACPVYGGGPVDIVFGHVCGLPPVNPGTVVVPIRSVYMTINTFSLIRLDNGFPIPAAAMTLGLDVDSWTWNFSFSVNGNLLPFVEPNVNGDPVIVQATINGTPLRLLVEKIGRERTFGSSQLRCSGRGISAALDAPYAPVLGFNNNAGARTVQQLLGEILTVNGVPFGWSIGTFDPTDWLVPTGVFSHNGTYISALNAVVGAAGAYLQPKDTTNEMDVLLRYPTPAWEWSSAIPDLILPSAVTSREGIEWVDKPIYDRVFVSGQQGGVSGRYTRAGTAGELLAPPVVDPLITHADAVRQRGRAIISDTGRIANVTLRLPVLAETGIIRPGTMVQYTDGPVERIGLSRSVSVDVNMPTVYQNIEVETHVE